MPSLRNCAGRSLRRRSGARENSVVEAGLRGTMVDVFHIQEKPMKWNPVIVSDARLERIGQWICFGGALVVLVCAIKAVTRYCDSPGQLVIGLLAALSLCMLMILLGIVTAPRKQT